MQGRVRFEERLQLADADGASIGVAGLFHPLVVFGAVPQLFRLPLVRQRRIVPAMEIFTTRTYERAVRKLIAAGARREMETAIAADPLAAPMIPGTGGIRKLRWSGSGRGKRGGIRTIYFYHAGPQAIYLLTAYAKADREDLTPDDKKTWSKLVTAIKKEERNR